MYSQITIWHEGTDPVTLFPESNVLTKPRGIAPSFDDSMRYLFIPGVNLPVENELLLMTFVENAITAEIYRTTPPAGQATTMAGLTFVRQMSPSPTSGVWIMFRIPHLVCAIGNAGMLGWAQSDVRRGIEQIKDGQ